MLKAQMLITKSSSTANSVWAVRSRSIDCQNLTGKAVVFGDSTRQLTRFCGKIHVVWAGTCKYDADWFREQVSEYVMKLLSQKIMVKLDAIAKVEPSAIFGTQMERHVGKLNIPAV